MKKFSGSLPAFCVAFVLATISLDARAQQAFKSPEEAADALVAAVRAGDRKTMVSVLGPGSAQIISSGDAVADQNTRQAFLAAFDAKHQVRKDGDTKAILELGQDDWPFPIPLVQAAGSWKFDTAAGRQEILYRRIGRNELATIQACLAYVDAQNDYADMMRKSGGMEQYARRIVSSPGKKDGLYWPSAENAPESPLGEAVATATRQGYRVGGTRAPFHGYYYKILTRQGPTAPGGAVDYMVRGQLIGGFALVAYPAVYGNSGVMTFLVNHEGTVFQKDLGPQTARIAGRMTSFNPDHTWKKAVETVGQQ
jgi:hypothetical protein